MAFAYVYIMASGKNGTLYVGMTTDLVVRVSQHREGLIEGFTKDHNVKQLVYYDPFDSVEAAIAREKNIKAWKREWKIKRIQEMNPEWDDLFYVIAG